MSSEATAPSEAAQRVTLAGRTPNQTKGEGAPGGKPKAEAVVLSADKSPYAHLARPARIATARGNRTNTVRAPAPRISTVRPPVTAQARLYTGKSRAGGVPAEHGAQRALRAERGGPGSAGTGPPCSPCM